MVLKGFGALEFNESLNGPKIALNIMNEGKIFLNGKYKYLLRSIQNPFKKFAFEFEPYVIVIVIDLKCPSRHYR
jgi:hypothetical protein